MRMYYTLSECSHEVVEVECDKCGRHGRPRPTAARRTGGFDSEERVATTNGQA